MLENLPGVDPNSEAIQSAMSSLTKDSAKKDDKKDADKKWWYNYSVVWILNLTVCIIHVLQGAFERKWYNLH